ncbi:hypothetical protein PEDI_15860 [Persicobacter diffluens]|uniref:DUF3857 domain-containing protein n=2 Tax=Persicobacter diffluens TaxID=981 RepID=A0AAN4VVT7_9BACT|nr:hypothetical protein PEDI_15860 [Persicobacter diffluens]
MIGKKIFLSSMLITCCFSSFGQIKKMPYSAWFRQPAVENTNARIHYDSTHIQINSSKSMREYQKKVLTIYNKKAEKLAMHYAYYNRNSEITTFNARILDDRGKTVLKLKKADIIDVSASGNNDVTDSRLQYAEMNRAKYPMHLELEYEKVYKKGFYSIPPWTPQEALKVQVDQSIYVVNYPQDYAFETFEQLLEGNEFSKVKQIEAIRWSAVNLPPKKEWESHFPASNQIPVLQLIPESFEYEKWKGSNSSWAMLGNWYSELNQGREEIPEKLQAIVDQLVAGKSEKEKIQAIYEWVQDNTRYISIQVGIGGNQSQTAAKTFDTGYGDCKALTTLTMGMLKHAGIKSHPALVYGGRQNTIFETDPVMDQFNHVILGVPHPQDTTWIECTSSSLPAGYLGTFTGNRYALWVDGAQSQLVKTQNFKAEENLEEHKATISIDKHLKGTVSLHSSYRGQNYDYLEHLSQKKESELKDYYYKRLPLKSFQINDLKIENRKESCAFEEQLDLSVPQVVKKAGNRLLLSPGILSAGGKKIIDKERHFPMMFFNGFSSEQEIIWEIPVEYSAQKLPEEIHLESEFGWYKCAITCRDQQLIFHRTYHLKAGQYAPELYSEYVKFRNQIRKYDNQKISLIQTLNH